MIIRMVLVWTVFSAVAAFDVFGANNEVTTNNREPAGLKFLQHIEILTYQASQQGNLFEENKIQLVEDVSFSKENQH